MSILQSGYPGDRAVEFLLIVGSGVALLLTMAWIVASRLPQRPAARHLVLSSAIGGSLSVPLLAAAFSATGFTLIAVPLLSHKESEPDSTPAQLRAFRSTSSAFLAAGHGWPAADRSAESTEALQHLDDTRGRGLAQPTTFAGMPQPNAAAAPGRARSLRQHGSRPSVRS